MSESASRSVPVLVDAHVHLYDEYDLGAFLAGARANFRAAAEALGLPREAPTCLLLAELGGRRWLAEARRGPGVARGWKLEPTAEPESLVARPPEGDGGLVVIAGRQIATAEGIEVLALAADVQVPDGLPLAETIARAREAGAVTVLPWGFGKWWSKRGRVVRAALPAGRDGLGTLFIGDNGNRPAALAPRLFAEAERRGIPVLPGSDPLPLPGHAGRAGSHGLVLEGPFDERRPAASLRALLAAAPVRPRRWGRPAPLGRFLADQVALRRRKRP